MKKITFEVIRTGNRNSFKGMGIKTLQLEEAPLKEERERLKRIGIQNYF